MPGLWTAFQIKANGTPSGTIANWNEYTSTVLGTTLSSCVYEDNTSSPVTLTMDGLWDGQTNNGENAINGLFEAEVRVSSYYIDSSGTMTWDFGGLDNGLTYEIRAIASRSGTSSDRKGDMTIGGTTITLDARGTDAEEIGTWTGVSPSGGVIQASYVLEASSSFAYINGFIIRSEDAAAGGKKLFLGLAGVGF